MLDVFCKIYEKNFKAGNYISLQNVFWKLQENTWERARKTWFSKAICLGNVYKNSM